MVINCVLQVTMCAYGREGVHILNEPIHLKNFITWYPLAPEPHNLDPKLLLSDTYTRCGTFVGLRYGGVFALVIVTKARIGTSVHSFFAVLSNHRRTFLFASAGNVAIATIVTNLQDQRSCRAIYRISRGRNSRVWIFEDLSSQQRGNGNVDFWGFWLSRASSIWSILWLHIEGQQTWNRIGNKPVILANGTFHAKVTSNDQIARSMCAFSLEIRICKDACRASCAGYPTYYTYFSVFEGTFLKDYKSLVSCDDDQHILM